ncbi:alpha/beta-hydrolase [Daldinia eschscholtzii]|nr:alpha/beta-hydrolase [Daldinia eschscholtzii]
MLPNRQSKGSPQTGYHNRRLPQSLSLLSELSLPICNSYIFVTAVMVISKPTLVIIHGAWHVPQSYSKLTKALKNAGYEVHVPRLPSANGARPPNADLSTDSDLVRSYVESLVDAGRTVVAIMHSYGGQVGTNSLCDLGLASRSEKGLPGGVYQLIYMCAFALPEGGSMVGKVREFGHEHLLPLAFDFAEDNSCVSRDPKTLLVGEGVDDAELNEYLSTLEVTKCAWREIPVAYIYTSADMTVPFDYQKSMVEKMEADGQKVRTVELATGHCPNLTMTKGLVDAIDSCIRD